MRISDIKSDTLRRVVVVIATPAVVVALAVLGVMDATCHAAAVFYDIGKEYTTDIRDTVSGAIQNWKATDTTVK